jgi:WD40 repeat protein
MESDHTSAIDCLVIFDGEIYCSSEKNIGSYKLSDGRHLKNFVGHTNSIFCLHVTNQYLFSGAQDHTIRLWDKKSTTCLHILTGHTKGISCIKTCKDWIISGSYDGTIKIWDIHSTECLKTLSGHMDVYSICVVEPLIISGSADGSIRVWELNTGNCKIMIDSGWVEAIDVDIQDGVIASLGESGIKIWKGF